MLKLCRTCLAEILDTTYSTLNKKDVKTKSVRAQLLACVPELQLDLVKDPVICGYCVSTLELLYTFKTHCLITEKQIQNYLSSAKLNGKRVTLTKLFNVSMKSHSVDNCSEVNSTKARDSNDKSNDPAVSDPFLVESRKLVLDVEGDNVEQGRTNDFMTLTANQESNVVMSSYASVVHRDEGNTNAVTNSGAIVELTAAEFRENILPLSSVATCTVHKHKISQDLHDPTNYAAVKEEEELLTFKTEVLTLKEENVNDYEERSNDCRTSSRNEVSSVVADDVKAETCDMGGNNSGYVQYEFSVPTRDDENFNDNSNSHTSHEFSVNANITVHRVLERTNNYSKEKLSQINATVEDNIIKEEHTQETFKTEEPLYEIKFKSCKSSFNVDTTLGTPLNSTTKKSKSVRKQSRSLSKPKQARSRKKSFRCNVCKYSTSIKGSLISHMRVHTGEKPFCCNVCDFKTSCNGSLTRHMRIHTGEKPYRCNVCEFSSSQKVSVNNHMLIHTGEKPYRCNVCNFNLTRKDHLTQHLRIHTGEKPFRCEICEFKAAHKSSLIRHKRIHTGEKPFRCGICEFSTAHKKNLTLHLRSHTGEKPYRCNNCEYRAAEKYILVKHMQKHRLKYHFVEEICPNPM